MERVLLVVSRHPWPPRTGDRRRALQAAEMLSGRYEVTLLAPEPPPGTDPVPGSDDLPYRLELYPVPRGLLKVAVAWRLVAGLVKLRPFQNALFGGGGLARALRRLAPEHDLAVLQTTRLAGAARHLGTTPLLVDLIDSLALSTRLRARYDLPILRPLLWLESRLLARTEDGLVRASRAALLVAERDRAEIEGRLGGAGARPSNVLRVVPVAFDAAAEASGTAGTAAAEALGTAAAEPGHRLVVTGNFGYFPTRDGIRWFLREVWPDLERRVPGVRLVFAGSRAPGFLRRAPRRDERIILHRSPSDLALTKALGVATLALAPMRAGAGQPLKVMESWAAGIPVVATPWAAEGTTGEPEVDLALAEGPEEWVETIISLLEDPERLRALARAGRARLVQDYSREAVQNRWLEMAALTLESPTPDVPDASGGERVGRRSSSSPVSRNPSLRTSHREE